jgi:hypothetical protein
MTSSLSFNHHKSFPLTMEYHSIILCRLVKINGADGNMRQYQEALEGEDFVPEFNTIRQAANVPNLLRPLIRALIDKRRSHLLGCTSEWDTIIYYHLFR